MIPKRPASYSYLKYTGLAFQLFLLLLIGAWLGGRVDKWLHTPERYFTILFILLFTGGFFYRLVKELNRKDES